MKLTIEQKRREANEGERCYNDGLVLNQRWSKYKRAGWERAKALNEEVFARLRESHKARAALKGTK